jgi:hypothetical protein
MRTMQKTNDRDPFPHISQNLTTDVPNMGDDRLLRIGEVAELLGLAVGTVYHLVSRKKSRQFTSRPGAFVFDVEH